MKYPFVRAPNWSGHVIGSFALFTVCGGIGKSCGGENRRSGGEGVNWTSSSALWIVAERRARSVERSPTCELATPIPSAECRCFAIINIELGKNCSPHCGCGYLLLLLACSATLIKSLLYIYLKQGRNPKVPGIFPSSFPYNLKSQNKFGLYVFFFIALHKHALYLLGVPSMKVINKV